MKRNIILAADSYKASHWPQYPEGTEAYQGYIEARSGDHLVFFGLQMYIQDYLMTPITQADIDQAAAFFAAHGEPFNREGWEYILKKYNGYMPVVIRAVPEGTVIKNRNCIAIIECHDPKCFWVASYLETSLLRAIWYPSTVATISFDCKQTIERFLRETSDAPVAEQIAFKLHDFGGRGVSSGESAALGGAAHLVNFMGSDTVEGVLAANTYYDCDMAAFSIPAAEHSTITSWGKENEVEAYRNMLKQYGGEGKLVAVVSDSYDIFKACEELWGGILKDEVMNMGGTLVIRPDSGDPAPTVTKVVEILMDKFGYTTNSKGYRVLPPCVRVIQGDGINNASINEILASLKWNKMSAENVGFGMGGALLQHCNRDTYGFAMKCCALKVNGVWRDVYKEATGKASKRGRLNLVRRNGEVQTIRAEEYTLGDELLLRTAYAITNYGPFIDVITFDEVRANAAKGVQK